ncbi:rRNA maturation RNase YbeY [Bacillaceae bacterium S4-13-56]
MNIEFQDQTNQVDSKHLDLVENLLNFAAEKEDIGEEAEVSITFVTDQKIQEMNKEYRQKDQPTDVISFAMQEMGEDELEIKGENLPVMLGDIIISVDRTREQADTYEHSFERELGFLALHGFLHLLGYDHMTDEDEKKMFGRQEELLYDFGLERK